MKKSSVRNWTSSRKTLCLLPGAGRNLSIPARTARVVVEKTSTFQTETLVVDFNFVFFYLKYNPSSKTNSISPVFHYHNLPSGDEVAGICHELEQDDTFSSAEVGVLCGKRP